MDLSEEIRAICAAALKAVGEVCSKCGAIEPHAIDERGRCLDAQGRVRPVLEG